MQPSQNMRELTGTDGPRQSIVHCALRLRICDSVVLGVLDIFVRDLLVRRDIAVYDVHRADRFEV